MKLSSAPWWETCEYPNANATDGLDISEPALWGPYGPALVKLWEDGRTSSGWGRDAFMAAYGKLEFNSRRILHGYEKNAWAFAWVMRSAKIVCVDIDGKNGGFDHVSELGFLPPTVAEISMSGNGYHLFYEVDDTWDPLEGFAKYTDVIGLVIGVDIRGTGCVFHKPTQRWNNGTLAKMPEHLSDRLLQRSATRARQLSNIKKTLEMEDYEVAIMHDELIGELKKPIANGKRNQTLFAIGSQMAQAQVPDWAEAVGDRATQVGLDSVEIDKLISNITVYGEK